MKNDMPTRIKDILSELGITQQQLADISGVSKAAVNAWINKGTKPSGSALLNMRKKRGINPDWVIDGKGEMFLASGEWEKQQLLSTTYKPAPVVGTAQLGPDGYWDAMDYPVGFGDGFIDVPSGDPNAYALRVRGDSMAPAIRDGWYVVIEPNNPISPGEYVLLVTTDGQAMVKELLWERGDQISLMSVNDQYGRFTITRDKVDKIHHVAFIAPPSKHRL